MKAFLTLIVIVASITTLQASYFEHWMIEGKVTRVYDAAATRKLLEDNPEFGVVPGDHVGLRITLDKCFPVGGHGGTKCKEGETRDIVLGHDPKAVAFTPSVGMRLRMSYIYSDSAVPAGFESRHHEWRLVAVLPGADGKKAEE